MPFNANKIIKLNLLNVCVDYSLRNALTYLVICTKYIFYKKVVISSKTIRDKKLN